MPKKPRGFDKFDKLMQKLVKVPPPVARGPLPDVIVDPSTGKEYKIRKRKKK